MVSDKLDLLSKFNNLDRHEQYAFIAWFSGGLSHVTKYGNNEHVFMGKAECEWVDFDEFWLNKLPELGWINVKEVRKFIAKGMVGEPTAIEYQISATTLGFEVRKAYYGRPIKRIE